MKILHIFGLLLMSLLMLVAWAIWGVLALIVIIGYCVEWGSEHVERFLRPRWKALLDDWREVI
jgi:hypothetical protein